MEPEPNEPTSPKAPPTRDSAPNERDERADRELIRQRELIRNVGRRAAEQRKWLFQSFREMEKTAGRSFR